MQEEALTQKIIGGAFRVHNTLGAGFLETMVRTLFKFIEYAQTEYRKRNNN